MTPLHYVSGSTVIPANASGISPSQIAKFFNKPHEWYQSEVLGNKTFTGNTSSYLGTIVHFIASEFATTQSVRKHLIYQYLYEELVTEKLQKRHPFDFESMTDFEEIEDFLKDNTDPEFVNVEYIFNNYRPMGNALIQFIREKGLPQEVEKLIHQEVLPGYFACGSVDAIKHKRRVQDYKTTSDLSPKDKIPYEYKLQLLVYAWILRKNGYPIDSISIIWITHNQVNRRSEVNGKPMKDYPTQVSEVIEYIDEKDFQFIESLLKLIAESLEATIKYPHLTHIIWKDYRLK